MKLNFTWETVGRILFCSMAIALPLSSAGCGQTACIAWSAAEGACPAQSSALAFFKDPTCPGPIVSVDSEGDFANDLCCYAVSKQDTGRPDDTVPCASEIGRGGAGGSFGVGSAVTTVGVGSTGGTGGAGGGPPGCLHCAESFFKSGLNGTNICQASLPILDALTLCLCSGACAKACGDSLCFGLPMSSQACEACGTDSASGCGDAFSKCLADG